MHLLCKLMAVVLILLLLFKVGIYLEKFIAFFNVESKTNTFYRNHFCAMVGFPIAVYLATTVTSITGLSLLFSRSDEIIIFGFKNVKGVGLATLWLCMFIAIIFCLKFIW